MTDENKPAPVREYSEKYQREIYRYHNGSLKDCKTGYWLESGSSITTSEQGRELVGKRYSMAQARAVEGQDQAALDAGLIAEEEVGTGASWRAMNEHATKTFFKSNSTREMSTLLTALGKNAGHLVEEKAEPTPEMTDLAVAVTGLLNALREGASRLRGGSGEVIDAE